MPSGESISQIEVGNLVHNLSDVLTSEVLVLIARSPSAEVAPQPLEVLLGEHAFDVTGGFVSVFRDCKLFRPGEGLYALESNCKGPFTEQALQV